jgi:pyocin large subunit-like protein
MSDGLCCRSSNAEIGKAAGRHADTVDEYLSHLERAGIVGVFGRRNGLKSRVIVLLDHPDAETFMRSLGMNNRLSRWDWMIADCEEMNS